MTSKADLYRVVGKSRPRVDGPVKATGRAQYTDDFVLPGMLHGRIVRSTIPRGKILRIDTSKAEKLPGVRAVITHKDIVDLVTPSYHQLLRSDTVNFVGEEIAAVAAVDEDTAFEAAELVSVEYEPMEPVFSMKDAMAEGTPVIHEGHLDNVADEISIAFGDVGQAFSEAEHVRVGADTYTIQPTHNCFAEQAQSLDPQPIAGSGQKGSLPCAGHLRQ